MESSIGRDEMRHTLRRAVKTYYDLQKLRILLSNRIGVRKSGENMARISVLTESELVGYAGDGEKQGLIEIVQEQMDVFETNIKGYLEDFPIYVEWLQGITGIDWTMGGIICSEYDIHIASTPSKLCAYTGLNPGMTRGMKFVKTKKPETYKPKDGEVTRRTDVGVVVRTYDLVRGDKLTEGYLAPFNQWLRSKMIGVLAVSFIRTRSYYSKFYYQRHVPVSRRDLLGTGRYDVETKWEEESEGHKSNAAKRFMIKIFLQDLYKAWRALEGLEVRPPYAEEYLDKVHHDDLEATG